MPTSDWSSTPDGDRLDDMHKPDRRGLFCCAVVALSFWAIAAIQVWRYLKD